MSRLRSHRSNPEGGPLPLVLVVDFSDGHSREVTPQIGNQAFEAGALLFERCNVGDAKLGAERGGVHGAS